MPSKPKHQRPQAVKVKIKQGIIHINSISVLQRSDTAILLYCDTKQKYPAVSSQSARTVMIGATEETLWKETASDPAEIIIEGLEGEWNLMTQTGRYYVEIALIKLLPEREKSDRNEWMWCDDDGNEFQIPTT